MNLVVVAQCQKELQDFPEEVRGDVLDAIEKLRAGLQLSMPLSRPMPSLGQGINELRLKDRSGQYRVIYVVKSGDGLYLVHAFTKKTQETPRRNIETALRRKKLL